MPVQDHNNATLLTAALLPISSIEANLVRLPSDHPIKQASFKQVYKHLRSKDATRTVAMVLTLKLFAAGGLRHAR